MIVFSFCAAPEIGINNKINKQVVFWLYPFSIKGIC